MAAYQVLGMSCAACSARVEKAVSAVEGVTACSVNLLTNSMVVEGDFATDDIIRAVEKAGYRAAEQQSVNNGNAENTVPVSAITTAKSLVPIQLGCSIVLLLVLMYVSMGHGMFHWWMPSFFMGNHIANGLLQMLLSGAVLVINQRFFVSGFKAVTRLSPNMDTLVALGSGVSFAYSVVLLFLMTGSPSDTVTHHLYFESAAMIVTLITVGKMLEARAKGKTTDAVAGLMRLVPKTAQVIKDGREVTVPIESIKVGDVFAVRSGERIPVDGVVIDGNGAVDESSLTGESIPVDKEEGDTVSAATMNMSGYLRCRATRVGNDTTLSQIVKMVSDAAASKAPIAKVADRVSGVFVPIVLALAIVTAIVWIIVGESVGFALARGVCVLVISCPCALGLATPVAIMVGSGVGAKNGILFKTATSLEQAGKVSAVVLDKTGTVTNGTPRVTAVLPMSELTETQLMEMAFSLEKKSEHPLARAVVAWCEEKNIAYSEVSDFEVVAGNGLKAIVNNIAIFGGNRKYISDIVDIPVPILRQTESLAEKGQTPLFFADAHRFLGAIVVADTVKEESATAIQQLKNMGIHTVMLTGDNTKTARAIAADVGVDDVIADVMPNEKATAIQSLQEKYGHVMMVGDGINDAPALTVADTGVAIGAGTDVAIDAADIVLAKNNLLEIPAAIRLSRATLRNIRENLFWAFVYNVIGIPLAAGVWTPIFGWELDPMFGAAAMSLSSFCVVSNALRLNYKNIYKTNRDKRVTIKTKEETNMKKTMKIEGMMCPHCSGRVKTVLEALDFVQEAVVSHENGTAIVTVSEASDDMVLKNAVEAQGYTVITIE